MNFLMTNMTSFRNKGCEASAKVFFNQLTGLDEKARLQVFSEDVDYDAFWTRNNQNVIFLKTPFKRDYCLGGLSFVPRWWQYRLIGKLSISPSIKSAIDNFREVDAVLSTGGDVFSSTYGDLIRHLAPLNIAASLGKPLFLIGHSIGPFDSQNEKKAYRKLTKNIQLVTVRESLSLEYLRDMALDNARIELTADPAFCLNPDMENINKICKLYNIPKDKPVIGVAPSQGISYYSHLSYEKHFDALQKLLQFLTKKLGYHVVLVPHVHLRSLKFDDRVMCELLYRKLNLPEDVSVVSFAHSAEEIRALVGTFDFMIAERMHAAIASLSQNVPTFVIGYSVKAKGIMGDIFGFNSLEDYLIPVKEMDPKRLCERVGTLLEQRRAVTKTLAENIPEMKERAKRNFTLIMDALEQKEL